MTPGKDTRDTLRAMARRLLEEFERKDHTTWVRSRERIVAEVERQKAWHRTADRWATPREATELQGLGLKDGELTGLFIDTIIEVTQAG